MNICWRCLVLMFSLRLLCHLEQKWILSLQHILSLEIVCTVYIFILFTVGIGEKSFMLWKTEIWKLELLCLILLMFLHIFLLKMVKFVYLFIFVCLIAFIYKINRTFQTVTRYLSSLFTKNFFTLTRVTFLKTTFHFYLSNNILK